MLQEMDPYVGLLISIHAPRAGSDKCSFGLTPSEFNFNPRSPCGERPNDGKIGTLANNFNPRSPCGERRFNASFMIFTARLFQSTLPVRGATRRPRLTYTRILIFQSTLPVRGATMDTMQAMAPARISIHAPRAGSDSSCIGFVHSFFISIHAPRAGSDLSAAG